MKTVIAGSRSFTNMDQFRIGMAACPFTHEITTVLHGAAIGTDRLAHAWAEENNIPIVPFPVTPEEWQKFGKPAGPKRNIRMIDQAEAYIGFWDGRSPGTKQGIEYATKLQRRVFVFRIDEPEEQPQGLLRFME